jgi:hypothetical protein
MKLVLLGLLQLIPTRIMLSLFVLHTSQITTVFTSHFLVVASNSRHSPCSRFLDCSSPQLPASHSNSSRALNHSSFLTKYSSYRVLLITPWYEPCKKHSSSVAVQLLPWKHVCLRSCYMAVVIVYSCCLVTGLHATILILR